MTLNKWSLLLAVVMAITAPEVSYAQLGALGDAAKAKAVEKLTNGVMQELEKKFTEIVAKEPLSAAAKANIVKKLSEMSRPIVSNYISGAASGKLPNPAELSKTVLNDILPQVQGFVTAALTEDGGGAAGQAQVAANAQLQHNYDDEKDFTVETINDGSAVRIIKYTGKSTELRIPPRIGNLTVAEIGDRVFMKKGLVSVAIPESVIFIGNMAFADNQIGSVSIGANVYIANNAFEISGYNSFSAGFYNSQGRKAGTYNNNWRLASAAASASVTQTTAAQQSAAPTANGIDGNLGAFSLELADNFKYADNYQIIFTDKRLFNGHRIIPGETYTLKITYTASRDLENTLGIMLVDTTPAAKSWKLLSATGGKETWIAASKAGKEVSATITLKTKARATDSSEAANALVFNTRGKGKQGVAGSGKQGPVTLNFTEFVFTREGDTTGTTAQQPAAYNSIPSESAAVFAGNGHTYEVIDVPMTWTGARSDCEKRGGYLVTITSTEEQVFIEGLLSKQGKQNNYWLGGYREGKNWQWVTGENFTYNNWMPGEPNNAQGTEDKTMLARIKPKGTKGRAGQWNDSRNNDNSSGGWGSYGYICEWD